MTRHLYLVPPPEDPPPATSETPNTDQHGDYFRRLIKLNFTILGCVISGSASVVVALLLMLVGVPVLVASISAMLFCSAVVCFGIGRIHDLVDDLDPDAAEALARAQDRPFWMRLVQAMRREPY